MSELFLKVLNMSIAAGWLVLAVIILRLVLKKAPRWIPVLLWGIVAVRLLCPISIESALSLIPSAETISPEIMLDPTPEVHTGVPAVNSVINPIFAETFTPEPAASANPLQIWIPVASILWIAGMVLILLYTAVSCWRLGRKVSAAVRMGDNLYRCEFIQSPFVLGVFRPRIYLPWRLEEWELVHVIAHEQTHIRRMDHWWKPLGFLLLTVHWFNPLMWAAYILLCRDIELACDEKVIRTLSREERADYSQALLECSVDRKWIAACPLAFGEVGVKERVKNVLHYKKPAFWVMITAIVCCIAVAVSMLTNPVSKTTPAAVLSELNTEDVQWAQATFWDEPGGTHLLLDREEISQLTEILKSIESDDYEENVHGDNDVSIMLYCGDQEILLGWSGTYVHFSFDSDTAASLGDASWGVSSEALNEFFRTVGKKDEQIHQGISSSAVANDFEICLYADKGHYTTQDAINIWATLEYQGPAETVTIWHGDPYISFIITDGKDFTVGGLIQTILTGTELNRGEIYRYDYAKSGGYGEDDPDAAFWRAFFQEEELRLPAGTYTVSVSGAFHLSQEQRPEEHGPSCEFQIVVTEQD